jgi:hypothetical protein
MCTSSENENEIELRLQELRRKLKIGEIANQIIEQQREVLDMLAQS